MAKRRNVEASTPAPEVLSGGAATKQPKMTQVEAVRRALAAGKSMPQEGVTYIQETFGITMKPQMFSSYKSNIQKKTPGASNGRGRPSANPAVSLADTVTVIRNLVGQYGKDEVRKLVEVVS